MPSRRRQRSPASRPRRAAARSRWPVRPHERRGEHRRAAASEGRHSPFGPGRPLGLPERRDRRAGLRRRRRGRGGHSRGTQRQHSGQVLVESGAISEEQLARATGERYGLAYIDLDDFDVDRSAAALIRPSAAKRYQAVPVGFVGGGLLVALTDPADSLAVNDIAVMTKLDVQPAATTRSALDALLAELAHAAEANGGESTPAPAKQASSAVFWQAGPADDDDGGEETLPADSGGAAAAAAGAETERMRGELDELHRKLAGAETELVKARAELEASQAELATARTEASGTSAEQSQLITDLTTAREAAERAN